MKKQLICNIPYTGYYQVEIEIDASVLNSPNASEIIFDMAIEELDKDGRENYVMDEETHKKVVDDRVCYAVKKEFEYNEVA